MTMHLEVAGAGGRDQSGYPKVLCGIWTYHKNHGTNAKAVYNTWGNFCDKFIAFSDVQDESIGAIKLEVPQWEGKEDLIQKSRLAWLNFYKHHLDNFDFFF